MKDYPNTKEFVCLVETILEEIKKEINDNPSDDVTDEAWIEALDDCLYSVDLSVSAFQAHVVKWYGVVLQSRSDREYVNAIEEIVNRINKQLTENY